MSVERRYDEAAAARLLQDGRRRRHEVVDQTLRLLACPSPNPSGDTRAIAARILDELGDLPNVQVALHPSEPHIHNLVATVSGESPGRRLVFNGHLDTFPLGDRDAWTADPRGELRDDRLYGLGVSDMKGGLAASLFAFRNLAAEPSAWGGEAVIAFAGDEETMGTRGTQYLLDTVPAARGDAVICGDVGSPSVLRIGEKGLMWIRIVAKGRSCHAAHVHRGESAIEKLVEALNGLTALRALNVQVPPEVEAIVRNAAPRSEPLSGVGESEVLLKLTVTIGTMSGGRLPNLVADHAEATADLRLPLGLSTAELHAAIADRLGGLPGVSFEVLRAYEPTFTPRHDPVVQSFSRATTQVLGVEPVANMRVGASDARLCRRAGIPTVICGLTPNNMGAHDEYVQVEELMALGEIFTRGALDYLTSEL